MKMAIPTKMKGVVLTEKGATPMVNEIPVPVPGKGEVLIKMAASPINPSDLAFLKGGYGISKPFPVVPGFEGSGTVVKSGDGFLPKLLVGKKVACAASAKYNGCWAEYMVTTADSCVPLPKNISLDQGAMMFVNPVTALAFFDLYDKTQNTSGKVRGIINTAAASALGKMIIRLGKQKRIPVISIVRREEQVKILQEASAENVLNSNDPDFKSKLKEVAHHLNASIIFDAVGGNMVQDLLDAAPKGSKLFTYGRLSDEPCEINLRELLFSGNQIQGFWLTNWLHDKNLVQTLVTIRKVRKLIDNELSTKIQEQFEPDQINKAIETYKKNMSDGKVLIRF